MPAYAILEPAGWRELPFGRDIVIDDIATSYQTMLDWSSQMRTSRNIKAIIEDTVPVGKMRSSSTLTDSNGSPLRVSVFVDNPLYRVITSKADIWRRATDLETQMLDGALADAPAQLRRIYEGAQYIDHSDAEFPTLRAAIAAVVGDSRADELLAGST